MKCEVCGAELSAQALEANSCLQCGAIIDIDAPFRDANEYKKKAEFVNSIQSLMNTNVTENRSQEEQKQETLKKVNDAFEYRAEIIASNSDGTISSEKLNSQLKVYAEKGWRLANSFCNVIGKSQVAGYGGVTGGLAANGAVPITQIILIFERRTGAARRPAPVPGAVPPGAGAPGAPVPGPRPAGAPVPGAAPAAPAAPAEKKDLFQGRKPTPRPMTAEETAQLNHQASMGPASATPSEKKDSGSEDDGRPRIIPLR